MGAIENQVAACDLMILASQKLNPPAGRNKPWGEDIHIACAMMSAAPMAQTTMSKVMGSVPYARARERMHIKREKIQDPAARAIIFVI